MKINLSIVLILISEFLFAQNLPTRYPAKEKGNLIDNAIIFTCGGGGSGEIASEEATPIAIYKNGKYYSAPCNEDEREGAAKRLTEFKRVLSDLEYVFYNQDGVKKQRIKIKNIVLNDEGGMEGDCTYPELKLQINCSNRLNYEHIYTNNASIGTNIFKVLDITDRPLIFNKKINKVTRFNFSKNKQMDQELIVHPLPHIDINGDGTPELIYYFEGWEENHYFMIYSKIKNKWTKVFDERDAVDIDFTEVYLEDKKSNKKNFLNSEKF
jgi:hypothetical protein